MSAIALRSMTWALLYSSSSPASMSRRSFSGSGSLAKRSGLRVPGGAQRLAPPPPLDAPVVSREEDLRNLHPPELRGPRVVRVLEERRPRPRSSRRPRTPRCRGRPARAARPRRRRRAPRARRPSGRSLRSRPPCPPPSVTRSSTPSYRPHTRIEPPVRPRAAAPAPGRAARRAGSSAPPSAPGQPRPRRLDGLRERLGLHHHAGAAAVGGVVGHAVLARGVLADVGHPRREEPASPAPSRGCSPRGTPRTSAGTASGSPPRAARSSRLRGIPARREPAEPHVLVSCGLAPLSRPEAPRADPPPSGAAAASPPRRTARAARASRRRPPRHHEHVHPARLVQPGHLPDRLARRGHHRRAPRGRPSSAAPRPASPSSSRARQHLRARPAPPPPSRSETPSTFTAQTRPCGRASTIAPAAPARRPRRSAIRSSSPSAPSDPATPR